MVAQDQSLVELWVLAESLLIPALQDAVIDEIDRISSYKLAIDSNAFSYVYKRTSEGSQLRRLCRDHCLAFCDTPSRKVKWPKEFLLDVLDAVLPVVSETSKSSFGPCKHLARYYVGDKSI